MIGFSGFYNFSRSKKIKNFYESRFINNLDLSLLKVEGNNYYLSYVQNELDNKIFKKNGNYHLCIGDIYDSDFLKSKKTKSEFLYEYFIQGKINKFPKLNGSFIFIIIEKDKIHLGSDENSFIPIFYSYDNEILFFSYDINAIVKNLQNFVNIDYFNYATTIMTGGQGFNNSSCINKIKKFEIGVVSTITKKKIFETTNNYFSYNKKNKTLKKHLEEVSDSLKSAINLRTKDLNNLGLGLSGGIDSRILLAAFNKYTKLNLTTFIYGKKNFTESIISKEISDNFKLKHINFELPDFIHLTTKFDSAFYSNGETPFTTNPQIHVFGALKKIGLEALTVGSSLDCTAGYAWMSEEIYKFKTKKQLIEFYLNGHIFKFKLNEFKRIFNNKKNADNYYEYIYENMKKLLYSIQGDNIADINSSFFYESRGKRWYNKALILMLAQNKLVIPFYDTNFLKKISEVPTNIRKDDFFRIELLKFIDEDSSKFNYDATMGPAWILPPLNLYLKKIIKQIEIERNLIWFKSGFKETYSSNSFDANFFEWICKYSKYKSFIKDLLIGKDSLLIDSFLSKDYVKDLIQKQINGDNSRLRTLLILMSLETNSRVLLNTKNKENKIINFDNLVK